MTAPMNVRPAPKGAAMKTQIMPSMAIAQRMRMTAPMSVMAAAIAWPKVPPARRMITPQLTPVAKGRPAKIAKPK